MRRSFLIVFSLLCAWASAAEVQRVYVLPLQDDVEQTMVYLARRGVKEAMQNKADVLLIHLDTNGGRVDCTEEIIDAISHFEPQDQTYVYIDKKAFSAGSFIAAATRHIYMAPSSVIGAATPIMMSQSGSGIEAMPESVEQKMTSGMRGLARATAQHNGHNPAVFDAMIDRDLGLTIDGKEIVPKGKILTLTNLEAEASYGNPPKPLLSEGTVETLDAMVEKIGGDPRTMITLQPTGFEQLARLITIISPFLLTAGLILGYLEFKTGGFGFLGVCAALCFLVFFFGHYVAGLSGEEPLLLFLAGIVFIAVELFLAPGVVLPLMTGLVLVIFGILLAMADSYPTDGWIPPLAKLEQPLGSFLLSLSVAIAGMVLLARFFPSRALFGKLDAAIIEGPALVRPVSVRVGDEGVATTRLRPSGYASFSGETVDVVTEGMMLDRGQRVRVVTIEGPRIVVAPLEGA